MHFTAQGKVILNIFIYKSRETIPCESVCGMVWVNFKTTARLKSISIFVGRSLLLLIAAKCVGLGAKAAFAYPTTKTLGHSRMSGTP